MDDEERQAWIGNLKRKYGVRCIGDEEERPAWPLADVPEGATYTCIAEYGMASYDGVNFYIKPDGMPFAEFLSSLPKRLHAILPTKRRG